MEVNGTFYNGATPAEVIRILEDSRQIGTRLRLHYGDTKTGRDWLEEYDVTGKIGRSTGTIKIPLIISSARSHGGPGVLDHCIVKIRTAAGSAVLYQHPEYHYGKVTIHRDESMPELPFAVDVEGSIHARFKTEAERENWLKKMAIKVA